MEEKEILERAFEEGFAAAAVIPTEQFHFVPEYRVYCEENRCGNYGKNYGCPPDCGTTDEMKEKVRAFQKGLVLQTRWKDVDPMDGEEMKALKREHTGMTSRLVKRLRAEGLEGRPIMAGPCNFCPACGLVEGKPCPHEELRFSCLSAYCIDATRLAESCGMEISWTGGEAAFFSIYLFN